MHGFEVLICIFPLLEALRRFRCVNFGRFVRVAIREIAGDFVCSSVGSLALRLRRGDGGLREESAVACFSASRASRKVFGFDRSDVVQGRRMRKICLRSAIRDLIFFSLFSVRYERSSRSPASDVRVSRSVEAAFVSYRQREELHRQTAKSCTRSVVSAAIMFELPSFSATSVAHVTTGEPQCTLCQMIACPKLARDPDVGLVLSKQCAIHSAIVFVIVDYLWRAFQD